MQMIRNAIPNLLTLGNLACGLVAIIMLFDGKMNPPKAIVIGILMVGAMAFDFADGFAARALKATSQIGKELDSLSDLVSFGVLPGLMVYSILIIEFQSGLPGITKTVELPLSARVLPFFGLIIPLLSALRLAKFNVDTRQSYGFLGLPTPANALFFLSIFLIFWIDSQGIPTRTLFISQLAGRSGGFIAPQLFWLHNRAVLLGLSMIFSILLITEIPLLAMKFKDYTWKGNWPRYVLILISVTLLAILWFRAIPLIIILYFILSFIDTRLHKKA